MLSPAKRELADCVGRFQQRLIGFANASPIFRPGADVLSLRDVGQHGDDDAHAPDCKARTMKAAALTFFVTADVISTTVTESQP
jgi:hypothetical protein